MILSEKDLIKAVELAIESAFVKALESAAEQAIAPLLQRIDVLTHQVDELRSQLSEVEPEIADQQTAARLLDMSDRTLQRRRKHWVKGVHWWIEDGTDRPLYNLPLIRDGQRQGFGSPAHLTECNRWAKAQSKQRRKAG